MMPFKDPKQEKEYEAERYLKNKEKILQNKKEYYKQKTLTKKYGITPEDYDNMYNQQNGCCKICSMHQVNLKAALCVDHCHITGKVRGLLCHKCNLLIGHAKDDINVLQNAIKYLNENT
jgi:hypothetical protein